MLQNRKPIFSHLTLITVQNVLLHRYVRKFCTPQRKFVVFLIIQLYTLTRVVNSVTAHVLLLPLISDGGPHPSWDRLCGLLVRVSGYRYRGLGFDSRRYQIF